MRRKTSEHGCFIVILSRYLHSCYYSLQHRLAAIFLMNAPPNAALALGPPIIVCQQRQQFSRFFSRPAVPCSWDHMSG
jgi:hypothetical protein